MGKIMVKGYELKIPQSTAEQIYAVCPNGKTLSCIREWSNLFYRKTDTWYPCSGLPNGASFIGNYEMEEK